MANFGTDAFGNCKADCKDGDGCGLPAIEQLVPRPAGRDRTEHGDRSPVGSSGRRFGRVCYPAGVWAQWHTDGIQRWTLSFLLLAGSTGCLEPHVSDDFGFSPRILPTGSPVPSADDDAELATQIRENDGLEETQPIPRLQAFAGGQAIYYWDFGDASAAAVPFFQFNNCDDDGNALRGPDAPPPPMHPMLSQTAPGNEDYSSFWRIHNVCVTDRWAGEQMATNGALEDGVRLGLIAEPVATRVWGDCPFVLSDVRLEVGGGVEPASPVPMAYYAGRTISFFRFASGMLPVDDDGVVVTDLSPAAVYLLRRESEETPAQVVFQHAKTVPDAMGGTMPNPEYMPFVNAWDVVVADTADFSPLTSEASLVTRDATGGLVPVDSAVVLSVTDTQRQFNWPQQSTAGVAQ